MNFVTGFIIDFWGVIVQMAPFLLLGFLVAGLLSVFIPGSAVERHLGGRGLLPIMKASFIGVPLPLCSCGVIPVAASLRQHGASKGATVSFLLSTPETGVDSILVTWSLLGPVVAIFRPVVAFITGVIGGAAIDLIDSRDGKINTAKLTCKDDCCNAEAKGSKYAKAFRYGFVSLPKDIGPSMMLGILVAAVIGVIVPEDFFAPVLGGGIVSMFLMMSVGVPMYVCASASVPIAAALIAKGVSPGAAWVFLMTGPATNAAAIATIWNVLGRRTAIIYLLTLAVCAITSGIVLDLIITGADITVTGQHDQAAPGIIEHALAVVLFAMLVWSTIAKFRTHSHENH
jgi:uncharacterized membrane protein YraQ (UPF0718 family)